MRNLVAEKIHTLTKMIQSTNMRRSTTDLGQLCMKKTESFHLSSMNLRKSLSTRKKKRQRGKRLSSMRMKLEELVADPEIWTFQAKIEKKSLKITTNLIGRLKRKATEGQKMIDLTKTRRSIVPLMLFLTLT